MILMILCAALSGVVTYALSGLIWLAVLVGVIAAALVALTGTGNLTWVDWNDS